MSTHNICFHAEIRKILIGFSLKKCLIWSSGSVIKDRGLFHIDLDTQLFSQLYVMSSH